MPAPAASAQGAPLVAGWHKQWIRRLLDGRPLSDEEKAASFAFLDTEDYKEGLAAFLEKRKPGVQGALNSIPTASCRPDRPAAWPAKTRFRVLTGNWWVSRAPIGAVSTLTAE
jgi:hypothetical protein